jgi:hypothetical protein
LTIEPELPVIELEEAEDELVDVYTIESPLLITAKSSMAAIKHYARHIKFEAWDDGFPVNFELKQIYVCSDSYENHYCIHGQWEYTEVFSNEVCQPDVKITFKGEEMNWDWV